MRNKINWVVLFLLLTSLALAANVDVTLTAPDEVQSDTPFTVDITLNSADQNVKAVALYVTSENGDITFTDSSRNGDVWFTGRDPTGDAAVTIDNKNMWYYSIGPFGSHKESSNSAKKVVTVTATASQADSIILYNLNENGGTKVSKYPIGSLDINAVAAEAVTISAADPTISSISIADDPDSEDARDFIVSFTTSNFVIGESGNHIHLKVDGENAPGATTLAHMTYAVDNELNTDSAPNYKLKVHVNDNAQHRLQVILTDGGAAGNSHTELTGEAAKTVTIPAATPDPVCAVGSLNFCITQSACTSVSGKWDPDGGIEGNGACLSACLEGEVATEGVCVAAEFSCTGTSVANSQLCTYDDQNLVANVEKSLVEACTEAKCEVICTGDYHYVATDTDGASCAPNAACNSANLHLCDNSNCAGAGGNYDSETETCAEDCPSGKVAVDNVCVTPVCGDGNRQGAEQCDDGNTVSDDGCSAECQTEVSDITITGGTEEHVSLLQRILNAFRNPDGDGNPANDTQLSRLAAIAKAIRDA